MQAAGRRAKALAVVLALALPAPALAETALAATGPAKALELSAQSESLERQGDLIGAAKLLEAAVATSPGNGQLHWRIARDLLKHAEKNPALDATERAALYDRARQWAKEGREVAPDCAECCLYEFAGTARLATVRGIARAAGTVREAGVLLGQCLANPPRHRDESGSEEAALYYGASVYYRLMPDNEVMSWATGQRGDVTRAVSFARRAVALEGERPRYRLELGAALLCAGTRGGDVAAVSEGRRWLDQAAVGSGPDAERARWLRANPASRACELSHD
jgi:hypothetical protein